MLQADLQASSSKQWATPQLDKLPTDALVNIAAYLWEQVGWLYNICCVKVRCLLQRSCASAQHGTCIKSSMQQHGSAAASADCYCSRNTANTRAGMVQNHHSSARCNVTSQQQCAHSSMLCSLLRLAAPVLFASRRTSPQRSQLQVAGLLPRLALAALQRLLLTLPRPMTRPFAAKQQQRLSLRSSA